jgi:zinc protease
VPQATTRRAAAFALAVFLSCGRLDAAERALSNGVRLYLEPRPGAETVTMRVVIFGGDLADPEGKSSVARLHATLLLRGSREKSGFALARAAEELGGRLSSVSRLLAESVTLSMPAENPETGLRLLAEAVLEPRLDSGDLEKEKNLLTSSLATVRDEPSAFRRQAVYETLFSGSPLRHLALPSAAEIAAVHIEDVRAFHRAHVDARHVAVVIVGRFAADSIAGACEALFSKIPAGTGPSEFAPKLPPPKALAADVSRRVRKRTTQAEITVALTTEGISDAAMPAFIVLRHVLGGFQERLYEEIREKRGWAYWVTADGVNLPDAGYFAITTGAHEEHLDEIARIIRSELDRVAAIPVSPEELMRAIRYVRTEEARKDATNEGRAGLIVEQIASGAPARTYQERVARLEAVTAEQIRTLARRLFAGKHVAVVTLY